MNSVQGGKKIILAPPGIAYDGLLTQRDAYILSKKGRVFREKGHIFSDAFCTSNEESFHSAAFLLQGGGRSFSPQCHKFFVHPFFDPEIPSPRDVFFEARKREMTYTDFVVWSDDLDAYRKKRQEEMLYFIAWRIMNSKGACDLIVLSPTVLQILLRGLYVSYYGLSPFDPGDYWEIEIVENKDGFSLRAVYQEIKIAVCIPC